MNQAIELSVYILMAAAAIVLILEGIGPQYFELKNNEKPHIRLLVKGTIILTSIILLLDLLDQIKLNNDIFLIITNISILSLMINTIIAIFIGQITLKTYQNGEIYFLFLAALVLSIANVSSTNLIIFMSCSVSWMIVVNTLFIKTIPSGRKAEIGFKMSFSSILVLIFNLIAIYLIIKDFGSVDLDIISQKINHTNGLGVMGIIFLMMALIALMGIPPFHMGHIDAGDGGNISVTFLLFSNAAIQGGTKLFYIKKLLSNNDDYYLKSISLLILCLSVGFLILWLRTLDQSKVRRTITYMAATLVPLFCLSLLFGNSLSIPRIVFVIAMFLFISLALSTLYFSLSFMTPIDQHWQTWEDMAGFGQENKLQTLCFLISLASISGLPGTLGYFVKLSLIAPMKESLMFNILVFLSIAIGATCTMRIFVFLYTKQSHKSMSIKNDAPPIALVASSLILIALGFFPFVR